MSTSGSRTTSSSQLSQFGLYRTIDARTEDFLKLSRKKQIRQGCACAAVSTAITVTVVITVLLLYEQSIGLSTHVTANRNKIPASNDLVSIDRIDESKIKDNLNKDRSLFRLLTLLREMVNYNSYLSNLIEKSSTLDSIRETTEYPRERKVYSRTKNLIKVSPNPSERRSPEILKNYYLGNAKELIRTKKLSDHTKYRNSFDKMLEGIILKPNIAKDHKTESTTNELSKIVLNSDEPLKINFNLPKVKLTNTIKCECLRNLKKLLKNFITGLQDLIPKMMSEQYPCDDNNFDEKTNREYYTTNITPTSAMTQRQQKPHEIGTSTVQPLPVTTTWKPTYVTVRRIILNTKSTSKSIKGPTNPMKTQAGAKKESLKAVSQNATIKSIFNSSFSHGKKSDIHKEVKFTEVYKPRQPSTEKLVSAVPTQKTDISQRKTDPLSSYVNKRLKTEPSKTSRISLARNKFVDDSTKSITNIYDSDKLEQYLKGHLFTTMKVFTVPTQTTTEIAKSKTVRLPFFTSTKYITKQEASTTTAATTKSTDRPTKLVTIKTIRQDNSYEDGSTTDGTETMIHEQFKIDFYAIALLKGKLLPRPPSKSLLIPSKHNITTNKNIQNPFEKPRTKCRKRNNGTFTSSKNNNIFLAKVKDYTQSSENELKRNRSLNQLSLEINKPKPMLPLVLKNESKKHNSDSDEVTDKTGGQNLMESYKQFRLMQDKEIKQNYENIENVEQLRKPSTFVPRLVKRLNKNLYKFMLPNINVADSTDSDLGTTGYYNRVTNSMLPKTRPAYLEIKYRNAWNKDNHDYVTRNIIPYEIMK